MAAKKSSPVISDPFSLEDSKTPFCKIGFLKSCLFISDEIIVCKDLYFLVFMKAVINNPIFCVLLIQFDGCHYRNEVAHDFPSFVFPFDDEGAVPPIEIEVD